MRPWSLCVGIDQAQAIASDLMAFDKFWSAFITQPVLDPDNPEPGGVIPADMQQEFARQGRYTARLATQYRRSALTGEAAHQSFAEGFGIGTRFQSSLVRRVVDARPMQLGHSHLADGRWRIYTFGDESSVRPQEFAWWLTTALDSPIRRFTPEGHDIDSVIDVHAVFRGPDRHIDVTSLPPIPLPARASGLGESLGLGFRG